MLRMIYMNNLVEEYHKMRSCAHCAKSFRILHHKHKRFDHKASYKPSSSSSSRA